MKKMMIFEPAMCCSTGLCGVGVDSELLRISTILDVLKKQGIIVERYNLSNAPMEFVNRKYVHSVLQTQGVAALPMTVIDEEVKITSRYPSNVEIAELLGLSHDALSPKPAGFRLNFKKVDVRGSNDCCSTESSCCCGDTVESCCEDNNCCSEDVSAQESCCSDSACCSDGKCC